MRNRQRIAVMAAAVFAVVAAVVACVSAAGVLTLAADRPTGTMNGRQVALRLDFIAQQLVAADLPPGTQVVAAEPETAGTKPCVDEPGQVTISRRYDAVLPPGSHPAPTLAELAARWAGRTGYRQPPRPDLVVTSPVHVRLPDLFEVELWADWPQDNFVAVAVKSPCVWPGGRRTLGDWLNVVLPD
jgi:hypothetical protein